MDTKTTPPRSNGKTKLDQARAKRQTSTTQAVAATVSTPKRMTPAANKPIAKNTVLPADIVARGKRSITDLYERTGYGLSWSALVEVALRELLDREDFDAVIERYGASARRPDAK